ncbi:MAG: hypothetical protein ABL866_04260 [Devosia sp.]
MSRLATMVMHDARLQFRYGIYAAYAFVVAFYVVALVSLSSQLPSWVPAFIVFSDPAALGFFFLGALMMLERSEGVRAALATTPLTVLDYLGAKMLTLTTVAVASSMALHLASGREGNVILLAAGVALTSVQYIGIGIPIALRFKTVSGYLMGSAGFLTPVIAPAFLALLDPFPAWLAVIPSIGQFRLLLIATGATEGSVQEVVWLLAICVAAAIGAIFLAYRSMRLELGR